MNKKISHIFASAALALQVHIPATAASDTNVASATSMRNSYAHGYVKASLGQKRAPVMEDIINVEGALKANDQVAARKIIRGLDVNKPLDGNPEHTTILEFAVYEDNVSVVKLCLDNGADANGFRSKGYGTQSSRTPLMDAVSAEMVALLAQHKANLDTQDTEATLDNNKGNTALHYLVIRENEGIQGSASIIKALISVGADPLIKNENGDNAFDIASCEAIEALSSSPKMTSRVKIHHAMCSLRKLIP